MSNPLVSVCIPVFNGETYLEETLASVFAQTYRPLEMIISDDASKDNSLRIIDRYREKDEIPIHLYHHKPDSIGANWNNCLIHANGEFIKFVFQDDWIMPNAIAEMVGLALKEGSPGIVFANRKIVAEHQDDHTREWIRMNGQLAQYWPDSDTIKGTRFLKTTQLFKSPMNKLGEPSGVLLRKSVVQKVGLFNESLKQLLDYEYWLRMVSAGNVGFIKSELVAFRLHTNQATRQNAGSLSNEAEARYFYRSMLKHIFQSTNWSNRITILRKLFKYAFR